MRYDDMMTYKMWLRQVKGLSAAQVLKIPERKGNEDPEYLKYVEDFIMERDEYLEGEEA